MAKIFLEKTVRFNIKRKPALADSLLPYKIYINGQYVGALKTAGPFQQKFRGLRYII